MPDQLEEPIYRILVAQATNIERIETDLTMDGTTGQGTQINLWGPTPDIIRLYDTPLRFIEEGSLQNWERIVTLAPLADEDANRVIGRNDRNFRYMVQFLVRLTEAEIQTDRLRVLSGARHTTNVLAVKAHRLVYDWHHVFHDDLDLSCLVDDQSYRLSWDPGVEYPMTLFSAEVRGTRSAW